MRIQCAFSNQNDQKSFNDPLLMKRARVRVGKVLAFGPEDLGLRVEQGSPHEYSLPVSRQAVLR